jgi:transcriptional regulator NrdR family protein
MICPEPGCYNKAKLVGSPREVDNGHKINRRYECPKHGRFTTYEFVCSLEDTEITTKDIKPETMVESERIIIPEALAISEKIGNLMGKRGVF